MAQDPFQDITPRRSIRDIPLPPRKTTDHTQPARLKIKEEKSVEEPVAVDTSAESPVEHNHHDEEENAVEHHVYTQDHSRSPRWLVWSVIAVAAIVLFFASSLFFAGADVTVTPKVENLAVSLMATSTKDGANGTLPYDVIILNREEGMNESDLTSIAATATAATSSTPVAKPAPKPVPAAKASGTITIYNNYSSDPQTLIATTRFETSSGLIYRISKDTVVPGMTTSGGKSIAGSISAIVYADQVGEKYNIGPTTFTIPGLQGTAKYTAFSAKSTSSMTGGASGTGTTAASSASTAAASASVSSPLKTALEAQIQSDLIKEAQAQMPDNYILYPNASLFSFEKASTTNDYLDTASSSDASDLREQATAYFVIFDKDSLSRYLQAELIASSSTGSAYIENIDSLSVSLGGTAISDVVANNPLLVSIQGTLPVSWNLDSSQLADDLKGKSKQSLETVLQGYPEVSSAQAAIKPFWKSSFPDDSTNIKITIKK